MLAWAEAGRREVIRNGNFRRCLHPLPGDVEECHRPEGGRPGPEALSIGVAAKAKRRDNTCAGDYDAAR